MNRRRLLELLGLATASSGAVMGTGAFSSVTAERKVSVSVVEDRGAFLKLIPDDDSGLVRTNASDGTLEFDIPGLNNASKPNLGEGVGSDSSYAFLNLVEVTNQGTTDAQLYSRGSNLPPEIERVGLVGPNGAPLIGSENTVPLTLGETLSMGLFIETAPGAEVGEGPISANIQIIADTNASND